MTGPRQRIGAVAHRAGALLRALARPHIGLAYAAIIFAAPLGLWILGIERLTALATGGRGYVLSLSSSVVVFGLLLATLVRHRATLRRWWPAAAGVALAVALWSAIGLAHHGLAQTLVGLRITLLPLALMVVVAALRPRERATLVSVLAWLLVANGIAAIAEVVIGPARLVAWGFEENRAVRYIDGVFRVPGLTEFNAELGMLAGGYLLGYVALWLTVGARPRRRAWHAGALAAVVCLGLSTSRSGALLAVGGVAGAVLLNRSADRTRRRLSLAMAGMLAAGVAAGFAILGTTGASSLLQRFEVWASLLRGVPPLGHGVGSAGAATSSRIADSTPVFVDNYFVSLVLQFGPVLAAALVGWLGVTLVRLWRRSATDPGAVPYLAALAGFTCAALMIEVWEYPAAMLCLILFAVHGGRSADQPDGRSAADPPEPDSSARDAWPHSVGRRPHATEPAS